MPKTSSMTSSLTKNQKIERVLAKLDRDLTEDEKEEAKLVRVDTYSMKRICASCGQRWGGHMGALCPHEQTLFTPVE